MQNNNVRVREFGIGIKKGPRISYLAKSGRYEGMRFSFYPMTFFLGAFVDAEEKLFELPYKKRSLIFFAGPLANIHFGCLLYILLFASTIIPAIQTHVTTAWGMSDWILYFYYFILSSPFLWVSILAIFILWFGRKIISAYLAPFIGIFLLAWLFHSIYDSGGAVTYFSEVTGPVGFAADLPNMASDLWSSVEWAAQLSIGLGAINLLPIFPLDGGYVFLPIVEKIVPPCVPMYKKVGMVLMASLMSFIIAKDIIMIAGYFGLIICFIIALLIYFRKKIFL